MGVKRDRETPGIELEADLNSGIVKVRRYEFRPPTTPVQLQRIDRPIPSVLEKTSPIPEGLIMPVIGFVLPDLKRRFPAPDMVREGESLDPKFARVGDMDKLFERIKEITTRENLVATLLDESATVNLRKGSRLRSQFQDAISELISPYWPAPQREPSNESS